MPRARLQGRLNQRSPLTTSSSLGSDLIGLDLLAVISVFFSFLLLSSKNIHESASFDRQLTGLNINTPADTSDKSG